MPYSQIIKGAGGLYNSPRFRSVLFQTMLVIALVALVIYVIHTVTGNLARLGIGSGFGFLQREGHFGIGQALIAYSDSSTYARAFFVALLNTLLVASLSIVTATILGFAVGLMRVSANPLYASLGRVFVEVNRNIPLLLHILFWYSIILTTLPSVRDSFVLGDVVLNRRGLYLPRPSFDSASWSIVIATAAVLLVLFVGALLARRRILARAVSHPVNLVVMRWLLVVALLSPLVMIAVFFFAASWEPPVLSGLTYRSGLRMLPELVALWICLTFYQSAFIAEIVRAGIRSVEKVQYEAADALTFTRGGMYRFIVIPQAARVIIPPYAGCVLNIVKDTSLGAAIGYPELMQVFWKTVLVQTGQGVEVVIITLGTYLAINVLFALLINLYSRKYSIPGR